MGKLYKSYAEALAKKTECKFPVIFLPPIPTLAFPPPIPLPNLNLTLPDIPVYCPLD